VTITGWRVWPYLASQLCLPIGLVLVAVNELLDAGLPPLLPWMLVLLGLPSAVVQLVAALRSERVTLDRGRS
jgi:hypothetical protein